MSELGQRVAAVLQPLNGVRVAWLFGSRARETFRPDSDLDLLVVYDRALDACVAAQVAIWRRYDDDEARRLFYRKAAAAAAAAVERMNHGPQR
jgi:predicted nucleotidyltransferase